MNAGKLSYWLMVLFFAHLTLATGADLLEGLGLDSKASRMVREQEYRPRGVEKAPAQQASAEGLPPLPLPVVPLRRTEKKNPPRPPVLIAKLATDEQIDWATSPQDADKLLQFLARSMNVSFSAINLPSGQIPTQVSQAPVLYRSGIRSFRFTDQQREQLRQYLFNGGTLILNAYCGHPDFARSALAEMERLLPERPPYRLSGDHPLYRSCYDLQDIRYRPLAQQAGARNGMPSAIGIDINTRTAVFFFRYDLSTAWDGLSADALHIIGYEPETAQALGANLMAYVTAERSAGVPLSQALLLVDAEKSKSGKLSVAQARYDGMWLARDNSMPMLLHVFQEKTGTPVRFEQQAVQLSSNQLFEHPLLYLTGTNTFALNEAERQQLRNYLQRGGVLFAEAACGRPSFDAAFRREMASVFPEMKLQPIPLSHLLYQYPSRIARVRPKPALAEHLQLRGDMEPVLLGIEIEGRLAVIYSPYDLSGGWALATAPYDYGLVQQDAMAMGINILSYALMH